MRKTIILFFTLSVLVSTYSFCGEIRVGTQVVHITPSVPVAVDGQMRLRVTDIIETPLEANILVLNSVEAGKSLELVVFITCDLVTIPLELRDHIREKIAQKLPEFGVGKVIVNATHTHTGAVVRDGWYEIPEGVVQPANYINNISEKIAEGVVEAWSRRRNGSVSWGSGAAKVAFNRRAVYADGSARMYGKTDSEDFRGIEGYENQNINTLFVWDSNGELAAACINVASPAQIVEGRTAINADYWHPVRVGLRQQWGKEVAILGWIDAAGDQTPRPMYGYAALKRMLRLQGEDATNSRDDSYLEYIASKIIKSVKEVYEIVKNDRYTDIVFRHETATMDLPMRIVKEEEYEYSKEMRDRDLSNPEDAIKYHRRIVWHEEVLNRYERQKEEAHPQYKMDFNILRIGDIAICTNSFELFTDYGIQIQARSPALQTFVIQLVGPGTYLPTERAVEGGHYSAIVQSNRVGPEGGQILVDQTLETLKTLWEEDK